MVLSHSQGLPQTGSAYRAAHYCTVEESTTNIHSVACKACTGASSLLAPRPYGIAVNRRYMQLTRQQLLGHSVNTHTSTQTATPKTVPTPTATTTLLWLRASHVHTLLSRMPDHSIAPPTTAATTTAPSWCTSRWSKCASSVQLGILSHHRATLFETVKSSLRVVMRQ
jgi:hypothetical protein